MVCLCPLGMNFSGATSSEQLVKECCCLLSNCLTSRNHHIKASLHQCPFFGETSQELAIGCCQILPTVPRCVLLVMGIKGSQIALQIEGHDAHDNLQWVREASQYDLKH